MVSTRLRRCSCDRIHHLTRKREISDPRADELIPKRLRDIEQLIAGNARGPLARPRRLRRRIKRRQRRGVPSVDWCHPRSLRRTLRRSRARSCGTSQGRSSFSHELLEEDSLGATVALAKWVDDVEFGQVVRQAIDEVATFEPTEVFLFGEVREELLERASTNAEFRSDAERAWRWATVDDGVRGEVKFDIWSRDERTTTRTIARRRRSPNRIVPHVLSTAGRQHPGRVWPAIGAGGSERPYRERLGTPTSALLLFLDVCRPAAFRSRCGRGRR